jgi:hypothetical protein
VLVAGRFGDEPLSEVEQVIRTDVLGYLHAARTALTSSASRAAGRSCWWAPCSASSPTQWS